MSPSQFSSNFFVPGATDKSKQAALLFLRKLAVLSLKYGGNKVGERFFAEKDATIIGDGLDKKDKKVSHEKYLMEKIKFGRYAQPHEMNSLFLSMQMHFVVDVFEGAKFSYSENSQNMGIKAESPTLHFKARDNKFFDPVKISFPKLVFNRFEVVGSERDLPENLDEGVFYCVRKSEKRRQDRNLIVYWDANAKEEKKIELSDDAVAELFKKCGALEKKAPENVANEISRFLNINVEDIDLSKTKMEHTGDCFYETVYAGIQALAHKAGLDDWYGKLDPKIIKSQTLDSNHPAEGKSFEKKYPEDEYHKKISDFKSMLDEISYRMSLSPWELEQVDRQIQQDRQYALALVKQEIDDMERQGPKMSI